MERSEVEYGRATIRFVVRRSSRRSTVALTVEPPGNLVVTAPAKTSIDKLNGVVRDKARWIVERVKRTSELPPPSSHGREFVTGETVLYLGRQYRLKVVGGDASEPVLKAGWLEVPVDARTSDERARAVRHGLRDWLKEHADLYLPDRLAKVCRQHGIERPSIIVREQRKRWGRCDARGTLRINWRIIQAAPRLIDYVLVHELVHQLHPNHTDEFWHEVERLMPDFERRCQELRRLGPSLEW